MPKAKREVGDLIDLLYGDYEDGTEPDFYQGHFPLEDAEKFRDAAYAHSVADKSVLPIKSVTPLYARWTPTKGEFDRKFTTCPKGLGAFPVTKVLYVFPEGKASSWTDSTVDE